MADRRERFTMQGIAIPPLPLRGSPGDTWPASGPARLSIVVGGHAGAVLRHVGRPDILHFFARRVVAGVPTGPNVNISTTSDFAVTEPKGTTLTIDLTAEFLARDPGVGVRDKDRIGILVTKAAGY